jgi:hypothetical protein
MRLTARVLVSAGLAGLLAVPASPFTRAGASNRQESPAPIVYSSAGADPAAITPTVNAFRTALGADNGDGTGSATGRREINWDDVPDADAAPAVLPLDYYRTTHPRGASFGSVSPGTETSRVQVSARAGNSQGTPPLFGNLDPTYPDTFIPYSGERLMTSPDGCCLRMSFTVPWTTKPAALRAFGVVVSDVDGTSEFQHVVVLDPSGTPLGSFSPQTADRGLSFIAVDYGAPVIGAIVFEFATAQGGAPDVSFGGNDVVAFDDMIYSEPQEFTGDRSCVTRGNQWFFSRDSAAVGLTTDESLVYGDPGDIHVLGDWDGDGTATPGVFRDGVWYLRNSLFSGVADVVFQFGDPGDIPVVGDWNNTGFDSPGVVRNGRWFLRTSLTSGYADRFLDFGNPGDTAIVGDWNGDGHDTPGVVRGNTWFVRNTLASGFADKEFVFGDAGDTPVVGDWNGDGIDDAGMVHDDRWYLANNDETGQPYSTRIFGAPGDRPLAWNP